MTDHYCSQTDQDQEQALYGQSARQHGQHLHDHRPDDGIGDAVWADDFSVEAILAGFFQALEQKNDFKDTLGSTVIFLKLLRSFSKDELRKTFMSFIEQFVQTKDFETITKNIDDHIEKLYITLQNYH